MQKQILAVFKLGKVRLKAYSLTVNFPALGCCKRFYQMHFYTLARCNRNVTPREVCEWAFGHWPSLGLAFHRDQGNLVENSQTITIKLENLDE